MKKVVCLGLAIASLFIGGKISLEAYQRHSELKSNCGAEVIGTLRQLPKQLGIGKAINAEEICGDAIRQTEIQGLLGLAVLIISIGIIVDQLGR